MQDPASRFVSAGAPPSPPRCVVKSSYSAHARGLPMLVLKARRAMTHGRLIGGKQPRTAGAARQQDAHLYAPRNEIVVPFSSTDSETRKRSTENWFCLEHIPRRSRFCYQKTATVLLPFCGTIFYKMSQTSPYNCTPACAGFVPVTYRVSRLAAVPLQEVAL